MYSNSMFLTPKCVETGYFSAFPRYKQIFGTYLEYIVAKSGKAPANSEDVKVMLKS